MTSDLPNEATVDRYAYKAALVGAVAIVAPWPWTLIGIKPVNDALLATEIDRAGPQTRALIVKWGALHGVRTALGALATVAYLWACMAR